MKKINAVIFFLFLFVAANSQTQKGAVLISGKTNLSFLSSKSKVVWDSISTGAFKNNQFGFDAGLGLFVADNVAVALTGSYSYSDDREEVFGSSALNTETITTSLAIVPQILYYFPVQGKLKPSVSIGAGYVRLKQRDSKSTANNHEVYSFSGLSLNGAAGVSYFITHSIAFELGLQYTHNKLNNKLNTRNYQEQNAFAATFGITVFFPKK